eukprot:1370795-Rhodomonas_salina.2
MRRFENKRKASDWTRNSQEESRVESQGSLTANANGKFVARCTLRVVFSHRSTERDSAACKSVDISTAIGLETRTEPESRTTTSISWAECQCTELGSESVHSARAHRVTRAETLRGTARASKLTCSCLLELLPVRTNRPASGPASHEASTHACRDTWCTSLSLLWSPCRSYNTAHLSARADTAPAPTSTTPSGTATAQTNAGQHPLGPRAADTGLGLTKLLPLPADPELVRVLDGREEEAAGGTGVGKLVVVPWRCDVRRADPARGVVRRLVVEHSSLVLSSQSHAVGAEERGGCVDLLHGSGGVQSACNDQLIGAPARVVVVARLDQPDASHTPQRRTKRKHRLQRVCPLHRQHLLPLRVRRQVARVRSLRHLDLLHKTRPVRVLPQPVARDLDFRDRSRPRKTHADKLLPLVAASVRDPRVGVAKLAVVDVLPAMIARRGGVVDACSSSSAGAFHLVDAQRRGPESHAAGLHACDVSRLGGRTEVLRHGDGVSLDARSEHARDVDDDRDRLL